MYGEGNSAKLLSDIVNGTTQVTEGISAGMGLDLKSLLAGALGGKLAAGNSQPVQVTVAPQAQPDAAAASADTPEQQVCRHNRIENCLGPPAGGPRLP